MAQESLRAPAHDVGKIRSRDRKEDRLQASVVDYIRVVAPDHIVFCIPNAARRGVVEATQLKRMGLLTGAPDLCLLGHGGRAYFLELKTDKGRLSSVQRDVRQRFIAMAVPHAVVRSISDVRGALAAWGINTREAQP